jgi:hypothetical protein
MLLKAPESDAAGLALAEWRAKAPFWNIEADRFRAAALEARRSGAVPPGMADQIESVLGQIREALQGCDSLIATALPGDPRLTPLLHATADFEALLESLHGSREIIEDLGGSAPPAKVPVVIAHRSTAPSPLR